MKTTFIALLLGWLLGPGPAPGQVQRRNGESAEAFARRHRPLPAAELTSQVLETSLWDGRTRVVVAFYTLKRPMRSGTKVWEEPCVEGYVFVPTAAGTYRRVLIDSYGQEGADAEIASVFFANADRQPGRELVVLCAWPQRHYDIAGTLYQPYFYAAPVATATRLTPLPALQKQFPLEFDGTNEDGKSTQARYQTAGAIRRKLQQLGY